MHHLPSNLLKTLLFSLMDDEEPIGWIGMVCVQCSIVCANRHYISNGVLNDDDDTYSLPNAAAATFAGLTSSSIPAI
jgi:hypothetical protein